MILTAFGRFEKLEPDPDPNNLQDLQNYFNLKSLHFESLQYC
jgi:hypothetical protein